MQLMKPAPHSPKVVVMLIDDDEALTQILTDVLEEDGYRVWSATSGLDALAILKEARPDLILLDLVLPDVDGLVLCVQLKERSTTPIIVLTARSDKKDAVLAFTMGVDDFIDKPFDLDELEARIARVVRQTMPQVVATPEPRGLAIDNLLHRVSADGRDLLLTPVEYQIMVALMSSPEHAPLSQSKLTRIVWARAELPGETTLAQAIHRIRTKLPDSASISFAAGNGYRLIESTSPGA